MAAEEYLSMMEAFDMSKQKKRGRVKIEAQIDLPAWMTFGFATNAIAEFIRLVKHVFS